jgi:sulfide dehydrogenase [flavocytochrome c] flavoprotein subunit
MTCTPATRRAFLKSTMAASAAIFSAPALAQGAGPRVVVVGGGFAGTTCARALKKTNPRVTVTLVAAEPTFTACPRSNSVIAGLHDLAEQRFGYDNVKRDGIDVALAAVTAIDPQVRSVTLAAGGTLAYDRLVLAPGIDFRWDAIQGYDQKAAEQIPHAYGGAEQIALLRRQLEGMEDGGTVVIAAPVNPARCPPAPYERASLIAHYLKQKKPRSKVIVLDAKDSFTMQKLFENAWKEFYPDLIEWVPLSSGGVLSSVDVASRTLMTDFDKYEAAVANVIPPQKAGRLAQIAGVADRTGWCPVDPLTFESKLQPGVHVIGDAAIAGAMPRSASAANSQAKICAAAIVKLFAGETPAPALLTSACYSLIAPDYAISQTGSYRPIDNQFNEADGGIVVSPLDAPRALRQQEAAAAETWFKTITGEVWG